MVDVPDGRVVSGLLLLGSDGVGTDELLPSGSSTEEVVSGKASTLVLVEGMIETTVIVDSGSGLTAGQP